MPKIIPNIREQLLNEARKQITEQGYGKTTIRSVANACNLGVGTVYNYFKSKDMLVATFMLEDWKACIEEMKSQPSNDPEVVLKSIYQILLDFSANYRMLFMDSDAAKVFAAVFTQRHKMLRAQIAEMILPICKQSAITDKKFLAEYIAESLLTWTVAGEAFEKQYEIIAKMIS